MEILTTKDFNQIPYNVPNAQAQNPEGGFEENLQFATYIDESVEDILVKLLGQSLYDSFITGLKALPPDWKSDLIYPAGAQIFHDYHVWESLSDGNNDHEPEESVYWKMIADSESVILPPPVLELYNGVIYGTQEWVGMKKMLIPYVYAMWLRDTYDDHTKNGVVRRKGENSDVIDPTLRIVRAYNKFSGYAYDLHNYLSYTSAINAGSYGYEYDQNHVYPFYYYRPHNGTFRSFGRYANRCKFPGNMNRFNI